MTETSETNNTRFLFQLRQYGLSRLILSADFLIALAVFFAVVADRHYQLGIFVADNPTYVLAIFAAASTLFAITLATLAIILSFSSSEFMSFLRKAHKLSSLLFLFWLGNASYLVVVVLSLLYLMVDVSKIVFLNEYLYPAIAALFIYALISTFYLLGAVIRFGYFLDIFDRLQKDGS